MEHLNCSVGIFQGGSYEEYCSETYFTLDFRILGCNIKLFLLVARYSFAFSRGECEKFCSPFKVCAIPLSISRTSENSIRATPPD